VFLIIQGCGLVLVCWRRIQKPARDILRIFLTLRMSLYHKWIFSFKGTGASIGEADGEAEKQVKNGGGYA
jgi:hypothetical protein